MVLKLREEGNQDNKKLIEGRTEKGCEAEKGQYKEEGWGLERDVNLKEYSYAQSLGKQEGNDLLKARYLNRE